MAERYDRIHYMNTGTSQAPVQSLINEGFVTFDDDLAPETESKQYIADKKARDVLKGYKPTYKYSFEHDQDDPVCTKLYDIGADQLIGQQVEIITVDLWTLATGKAEARKGTYDVIPSKAGSGDAGGALTVEGTLNQVGELIKGDWDVSASTFTADA